MVLKDVDSSFSLVIAFYIKEIYCVEYLEVVAFDYYSKLLELPYHYLELIINKIFKLYEKQVAYISVMKEWELTLALMNLMMSI